MIKTYYRIVSRNNKSCFSLSLSLKRFIHNNTILNRCCVFSREFISLSDQTVAVIILYIAIATIATLAKLNTPTQ